MTRFWRSTGSWMLSRSPPLGSVVLESLLATDSVMRVRGGSAVAAASWVPFSCIRCEPSDCEAALLLGCYSPVCACARAWLLSRACLHLTAVRLPPLCRGCGGCVYLRAASLLTVCMCGCLSSCVCKK
jgi:hypothetical protein